MRLLHSDVIINSVVLNSFHYYPPIPPAALPPEVAVCSTTMS